MSMFDLTPAGVFVDAMDIAAKRAREDARNRPARPAKPSIFNQVGHRIARTWTSFVEAMKHVQPATTRR